MVDLNSIIIIIVTIMSIWYVYSVLLFSKRKRKSLIELVNYLSDFSQIDNYRFIGNNLFIVGKRMGKIVKFNIAVNLVSTDVIFVWLTSIALGRRDLIILKGNLEGSPTIEMEILNLKVSGARWLRKQLLKRGWKEVFNDGEVSIITAKESSFPPPPKGFWRISIRKADPSVMIIVPYKQSKTIGEISKYLSAMKI